MFWLVLSFIFPILFTLYHDCLELLFPRLLRTVYIRNKEKNKLNMISLSFTLHETLFYAPVTLPTNLKEYEWCYRRPNNIPKAIQNSWIWLVIIIFIVSSFYRQVRLRGFLKIKIITNFLKRLLEPGFYLIRKGNKYDPQNLSWKIKSYNHLVVFVILEVDKNEIIIF